MRALWLLLDLPVGFVVGVWITTAGVSLAGLFGHPIGPPWHDATLYAGGGLGAFVAFRKWRGGATPVRPDAHGSARFGDEEKARVALDNSDGLIIGRAQRGWLMRYAGPSHLVTVAPTRSGKGVGVVIPNLLALPRAIFCIDPKGENVRIAARARQRFGPVQVLDPFGVTGHASAAFNPLDPLTPTSPDLIEDAAMIAEALVYDPPHQVGEAHWNEEAKALIAGLILHVAATAPPTTASLVRVRDLLTTSPQQFAATLKTMQASRAAHGLVARAANRHLGKSDREAAGVLSSAQRHTHFLDSPRMAAVLGRSDFRFEDLGSSPATIFLVLPPERLATHARWLRLLVSQGLNQLTRAHPGRGQAPVLFLLDEFAALGRLEPIERGFGLMAGYGVQLWAILQDLGQLKSLYGERASTFLANAGVLQVFNVADLDTASWVSRLLGTMTEDYSTTSTNESHSVTQPFGSQGSATNPHLVARPLMTPDEVLRMNQSRLFVFRPGRAPLAPWKVRYHADPEFRGLHDA